MVKRYLADPSNCVAMLIADVVAFVGLFITGHVYGFLLFWLLGLPSIIALHVVSQSDQHQ